MDSTRAEYLLRLNRVLDYIHANLDQPLSLEVLAKVAGFSPFHFHRLFKSMVGETLNDYVWRSRLEKAANWLRGEPDRSIIEICLGCGFSSPAVFSRAFRERFQLSPSQYRKQSKVDRSLSKDSQLEDRYDGKRKIIKPIERIRFPMNIEVKQFPTMHVAYVRHLTGYKKGQNSREIGEAFQRVTKWAAAHDLMGPQTLVIGIPYDNPEITPNDRCRYDACVSIPAEVTQGGGEVGVQDIPGGKYAVCHLEISSQETHKIAEAVDSLYGEWLPSSGYGSADQPALEIYYNTPNKPMGSWISMDFCVPIEPL